MDTILKKTNYFYVDESGSINNNQNIFIHGCIKTDAPDTISTALVKLKEDLQDELYYDEFVKRIKNEGFHATENNMDMRADLYKLLPLLNYRSYFVLINKDTDYFKDLKKDKKEHEIFTLTLKKLLMDRINDNKGDKNIFIFETIQISIKSLQDILTDLFGSLDDTHDCEFKIVGKEEENLGVIDYLNYIFFHLLTEEKPMKRMEQNFNLVASKIAVVNIVNNNVYLSRKKKSTHQVNYKNLLREFGG